MEGFLKTKKGSTKNGIRVLKSVLIQRLDRLNPKQQLLIIDIFWGILDSFEKKDTLDIKSQWFTKKDLQKELKRYSYRFINN